MFLPPTRKSTVYVQNTYIEKNVVYLRKTTKESEKRGKNGERAELAPRVQMGLKRSRMTSTSVATGTPVAGVLA